VSGPHTPEKDAFYTPAHRRAQDRFDAQPLADRVVDAIVRDEIDDFYGGFISSRDFFFLATVDSEGRPTVSYKGGAPGVVAVIDPTTIAFPHFDGNGMFLSVGNAEDTRKIGLLFIDLETPNRIRLQADVERVSDDPALLSRWPGAKLVTIAKVETVFHNCGRYIHRHERVASSPYVPDADGDQPVPAWKRIDVVQDVLTADDRDRTAAAGGTISFEDYVGKLLAGTS
jgi:predicted pyridoxine 5'-phosphate oxidase superfamily flavin-nucleotide-binding protein